MATTIITMVTGSSNPRTIARRLGEHCLDDKPEIERQLLRSSEFRRWLDRLRDLVRSLSVGSWTGQSTAPQFATSLRNSDIEESVGLLTTVGLGHYGLLRAVCDAWLRPYFSVTFDQLELDRGDALPLVAPSVSALSSDRTAYYGTVHYGKLLTDVGFTLYDGTLGLVILTYEDREALDAAGWGTDGNRPPVIATIHPYRSNDALLAAPETITKDWWFGFGPKQTAWNPSDMASLLKQARSAGAQSIAVLPELSVLDPDALVDELSGAWDALPELLVLGSTHLVSSDPVDGSDVRANESRVMLNGSELFRHRKRHPYRIRLNDSYISSEASSSIPEGITPPGRLTIASGTYTRLAVLICSDAMDHGLVNGMIRLGTNLLLVPALTPHPGSLMIALSGIPASCQGICVVANGTPLGDDWATTLFIALIGLPEGTPERQVHSVNVPDGGSRRGYVLMNTNHRTPSFDWVEVD